MSDITAEERADLLLDELRDAFGDRAFPGFDDAEYEQVQNLVTEALCAWGMEQVRDGERLTLAAERRAEERGRLAAFAEAADECDALGLGYHAAMKVSTSKPFKASILGKRTATEVLARKFRARATETAAPGADASATNSTHQGDDRGEHPKRSDLTWTPWT